MNLFKKNADGFYRGLGAEFAFKSKDGIIVISGGKVLRIALESGNEGTNSARIVIDGGDQERVVVEQGDIREVAARFDSIADEAVAPRATVSVPRRSLYAALAAFTALHLFFGTNLTVSEYDDAAVVRDVSRVLGGVTPPADVPFAGTLLAPGAATHLARPGSKPTIGAASPPAMAEAAASPILDKPAFLALVEEPGTDAKKAEPEAKAPEEGLVPSYSEGMYDKPSATPPAAVPEQSSPAPEKVETPAPAQDTPEEPTDEEVLKTLQEVGPDTVRPVGEQKPEQKPEPAVIEDEAQKKAETAPAAPAAKIAAGLVATGMPQAKAVEVAAQLEQLAQLGGEEGITPEILAQLPHDVARLLKENGLLENMEKPAGEAGVPFAIIRLPESVIDKYRGKDGIPAIPVNDSYAALGNKVSIPLPGGGDVKDPQDLEAFGFKP